MTFSKFLSAVVTIFAIFGLAAVTRTVFQADPALLASKILLLLPLVGATVLLMRGLSKSA